MDCPSEEQLIRLRLGGLDGLKDLRFDLPGRTLEVFTEGDPGAVDRSLADLDLGAERTGTEAVAGVEPAAAGAERRALVLVLAINLGFFLAEGIAGLLAGSMGLLGDGLDMLADAVVYGLALIAVGGPALRKMRIARTAGVFQGLLAVLGMAEVLRRFLGSDSVPSFRVMMVVASLALVGNLLCLRILHPRREGDVHMKASWIFTANDVFVNAGVIVAGGLVFWTESNVPDLVVGAVVFAIVMRGALRILRLGRPVPDSG
jgi:Co/Zn/Cd efflux system component